jgi:hypothetical protein
MHESFRRERCDDGENGEVYRKLKQFNIKSVTLLVLKLLHHNH